MPYWQAKSDQPLVGSHHVNTHVEQILDSSIRVVIASAQGTQDLIPGKAHLFHIADGRLQGFATQE